MTFRSSKMACLVLTAMIGQQAMGKDTYINKQFDLSNGSKYNLDLFMTDKARANILPYGFKVGVIGNIQLSQEDLDLESTAKFKRLYELAREASSKLKQSVKTPAPLNLTAVGSYQHGGTLGEAPAVESGSIKLTRLEQALTGFRQSLQANDQAKAYAQYGSLAALLNADENANDPSSVKLKKDFEIARDQFLTDGLIKRGGNPPPSFKASRKEWNGRVLRHLANLCFLDASCQETEFLSTLLFFDEFAPNALKTFYKEVNESKSREFSIDSYSRAISGEEAALTFFKGLAAWNDQDRAGLIDAYAEQIAQRVAESQRDAFKQRFQIIIESIFQLRKNS